MINDDLHIVHSHAAGLDVHKMQITASVRLCEGAGASPQCETRSFSTLPNGLGEMRGWLRQHQVQAAAMEATSIYWQRPYDVLREDGIEVSLYPAPQIKQLRGRKTDVQDSRWLARVCQFGLGSPSYVPDKLFRDLRELCRCCAQLRCDRSRVRNRIHQVLDRAGLRIGGILTDVFGVNGRRILTAVLQKIPTEEVLDSLTWHVQSKRELFADALQANLSDSVRVTLKTLLTQHDQFAARERELMQQMHRVLEPYASQLELLCTIPGISYDSAVSILVEIGPDLSAFDNANRFAAWSGVCPGNNESAGKRRSGRTRLGNHHLKRNFTECAHAAARSKGCQFHAYHKALTVRRGYKRAITATAHKLARTVYAVLRDQQPYRDPVADYQELLVRRNAPRWVRELKKFGVLQRNDDGEYVLNW